MPGKTKAELDARHKKEVIITIEDAPNPAEGTSGGDPDVQAFQSGTDSVQIQVGSKILTITIAE